MHIGCNANQVMGVYLIREAVELLELMSVFSTDEGRMFVCELMWTQ